MTDAPKPPKRRRRKVIFAFAVLVLVSAVSWWYWPRGDARFVGKWRGKAESASVSVEWTLYSNGSGQSRLDGGGGGRFCWRVEGDQFLLGRDSAFNRSEAGMWMEHAMMKIVGTTWPTRQQEFAILHIDETTIRLRIVKGGDLMDFKRIPE